MRVNGKVVFGLKRGRGIVEKYRARLIGLVGFKPFKGTLGVKLERNIDIKSYSTKIISNKITDGSTIVDAYLAPVRLHSKSEKRILKGIELEGDETVITYKWKNHDAFSLRKKGKFVTWGMIETEQERQIINELLGLGKSPKEKKPIISTMDCWAIQIMTGAQEKDVINIIAPQRLTESLGLDDGSPVEIEFRK